MERVIRFETELRDDKPNLRVGDPVGEKYRDVITGTTLVDSDVSQMILFEDARNWFLERFLVIELTEWDLRFLIEDRGKLPISNCCMQELKIQRHCKHIGIYENHATVAIPGKDPHRSRRGHEIYTQLRLLETAPRELAQSVMWSLFWELEVEPSYFNSGPTYWLRTYAPNFLEHNHRLIAQSHLDKVKKVMEQ